MREGAGPDGRNSRNLALALSPRNYFTVVNSRFLGLGRRFPLQGGGGCPYTPNVNYGCNQLKGETVPANTIKINNSDDFEWIVGDSKMEELIKWLEENGERIEDHIPSEKPHYEEPSSK